MVLLIKDMGGLCFKSANTKNHKETLKLFYMKWTKECIRCGNTFIAGRPNTKFCTRGCQQKAYQKKQKQKKIKTPPIKMETIPIIKKEEFKVPEFLLKEFINYMNTNGLRNTISSI